MLDAIRITPLAEESLGVRSMCTLVETPDAVILLDPGVSLAPSRFGLPPHPEEFRAVRDSRRRILEAAQQAEVVLASHYHFDHITPGFKSWYEWTEEDTYRLVYSGKLVLAKDIKHNINFSQRRRGYVHRSNHGGTGYGKQYTYDSRLDQMSPPYFLKATDSAGNAFYEIVSWGER